MNRRSFIKAGCFSCMSIGMLASLLQSCTPVKYVAGTFDDNGINIDLKDFETKNGMHSYLIVRHDELQYPICVYRISAMEYTALLMRCTHQGAELQVAGDQLTCPAHGSEFDKTGMAVQTPAVEPLRRFPVVVNDKKLFIDLRKQS